MASMQNFEVILDKLNLLLSLLILKLSLLKIFYLPITVNA
jgi:hypothetical protein